MAQTQDLSQLGDEEFMESWTAAAEELDAAKDRCRAFREDHERRLDIARQEAEAEKQRKIEAGEHDPSLDQTVGSI